MYIEHLARKIGYGFLLVYQSVLLILRIKTDLVQEWMSIKIFKNISVNLISILKDVLMYVSRNFVIWNVEKIFGKNKQIRLSRFT